MELLGIPGATLVQGGLGSLGLFLLLLIAMGRLIPRWMYQDMLDRERTRGDDFKAAWEAECQRADQQAGQLSEILTFVRQRPRGRP